MYVFEAETASEAWLKAADAFNRADLPIHKSRGGEAKELLGSIFVIKNPRQRWVNSRTPALNPAFALAEVIWIMNGRRDSRFLNFWNPALPKYAGDGPSYHGAYGYRLRRGFGFDQLDRAYKALKSNPSTRQVVLQMWDPRLDFPTELGEPSASDIPCNVCAFLRIRDGALHWTQVVRSNDLFLGVPHNFVQFTCLQEIVASWLEVRLGEYRHYADCLHVYQRDARKIQTTPPLQTIFSRDQISIARRESDEAFAAAAAKMEQMTERNLTSRQFEKIAEKPSLPRALDNWLLVISAECARRRDWTSLSTSLIEKCSDPALVNLWNNWVARNERRIRMEEAKI